MISKTIKYNDYNGNEREETFYFHLNKAELIEMQVEFEGGFQTYITKIIEAQNEKEILAVFKELLLKSYGEKSADGKRFMKIDEKGNPLYIAFSQTEAYSKLFVELASNTKSAIEFVKGVIPSDLDISSVEVPEDLEGLKKQLKETNETKQIK